MRAQISVKGRDSTSSPRTTRVEAAVDDLKVTYFSSTGTLRVHGECSAYYGSGMRGGDIRKVHRDLRIDLTKGEVQKMLAIALDGKQFPELELQSADHRAVTEVRREIEAAQTDLRLAQDRVKELERRIADARRALGEF